MAKSKNNYYAVKAGRKPGIYETWSECQEQIMGYSGAVYQGFVKLEDAEAYMSVATSKEAASDKALHSIVAEADDNTLIAYVDGSYSDEKRKYSYGCVLIRSGEVIEELCGSGSHPESLAMRNVSGELLGAITAIKKAKEKGFPSVLIHYDYAGIEQWANGGWKAKNSGTKYYCEFVKEQRKAGLEISFQKVQAHNGVTFNERADQLAREGMEK